MKSTILTATIFVLCAFISSSRNQIQSILYQDNYKFRVDTTRMINLSQFLVWQKAENNILSHCGSNLQKNMRTEIEHGVVSQRNYVSFTVKSDQIVSVDFGNSKNNRLLKTKVEKCKSYILEQLLLIKKNDFNDTISIEGKYYICL